MANTIIWTGSEKYLCDAELAQAFHMSRVLGMPLLMEGEPGTGKTELPIQFAKDNNIELFVYPVGSKSTVEQFVAKFDHVKYLRDSQIEVLNAQRDEKGLDKKLSTGGRSTENLDDYVMMGPGAKAYSKPNSVLLIDEIDKAPREFPNDLLYALSHRKFILPESGKEISVSEEDMPAIVITSNREQELPTAFKGRCIYHYISFPSPEMMLEIVHKHYPSADAEIVQKPSKASKGSQCWTLTVIPKMPPSRQAVVEPHQRARIREARFCSGRGPWDSRGRGLQDGFSKRMGG